MPAQQIKFLKEAQKFFLDYQLDNDFRSHCNGLIDSKKLIKIHGQPARPVSFYLAVITAFSEKFKDYYKDVFHTKSAQPSKQVAEFLKRCYEDSLEFKNFRLARQLNIIPQEAAAFEAIDKPPPQTSGKTSLSDNKDLAPSLSKQPETTAGDRQTTAYYLWEKINKHSEELKTEAGREALLKNPDTHISKEDIRIILEHGLIVGADITPKDPPRFLNPDGTINQKKWDQAVYEAASQIIEEKSNQTIVEQQPKIPTNKVYTKNFTIRVNQHRLDLTNEQGRQKLIKEGVFTTDEMKAITSTGLNAKSAAQNVLKGRGEVFFKQGPVQISSFYNPQKPYELKTIDTSQGIHHVAVDPQTSKVILKMPVAAGGSQATVTSLPMVSPIFKPAPDYPQQRPVTPSSQPSINLSSLKGLEVPSFIKDASLKGQILTRRLILRYATPMRMASLFTGTIGAIVGGSLTGSGAGVFGGAIGGAVAPKFLTSRIGGGLLKGSAGTALKLGGRAALASNPAGWVVLAASYAPQLMKVALYAILAAFLLPALLFFLKDSLLKSSALLNPTAQKTETSEVIPVPGGNTCDITGIDLFDGNAVDDLDLLERYISQSLATGLVKAGTDQERRFKERARFIRDSARSVGLNPAIFLGYWQSESHFSDYANPNVRPGADLGCDPLNRELKTFEDSVQCAIGKSLISNSRTSQCALSKDRNSSFCQEILFQKQRGEVTLPIATLQDFLNSYGSKIADPNNVRSDNIVKKVITNLGLGVCQGGGIPPGPTSPNFVYYCQGNTAWANTCTLGRAGCGPTTMAMILSSFSIPNSTPPEVDRTFSNNGWRTCGNNPTINMPGILNSSWLSGMGFDTGPNLVNNGVFNVTQAKDYLDRGYLIVGSSQAYPCANCRSATTVDHIFAIDAIDLSTNPATVDVRDPNNCSYADGNDENPSKRVKKVTDFPWYYAYPIKR